MTSCENELIRTTNRDIDVYLSVGDVLMALSDIRSGTPRDVAQNRLRESVVRLHCNRLEQLGYLEEHATEIYQITQKGNDAVENSRSFNSDFRAEYVEYVNQRDEICPRITDLSELDSYGVKETNMELFESSQDYGLINNDRYKTKKRILNVTGSRLYRIFREFPLGEPLVSQCAHWMRAFSGIHFFPDANHRTGMLLLHTLLEENGINTDPLPGRYIDRAVLRSKLLRILQLNSITLRDLWKEDEYYIHWNRYFRHLFHEIRDDYDTECSVQRLRRTLKAARGKPI